MHLRLHHHPSYSLVAVDGELDQRSVDPLIDVFSMVPLGQGVVLDLRDVRTLDVAAARLLRDELVPRTGAAHVAVVVADPDVAASLVMADLHRSTSLVRTIEDAVGVVAPHAAVMV